MPGSTIGLRAVEARGFAPSPPPGVYRALSTSAGGEVASSETH